MFFLVWKGILDYTICIFLREAETLNVYFIHSQTSSIKILNNIVFFNCISFPWHLGKWELSHCMSENTVVKLSEEVCNDPNHKLHQLLPPFNQCT